ncbi:MAG: tetratricopeptide repeat protein [Acidobacteria bacterium]|nr:tetratricopeptide repeat protein [Acidobacteriota bacterium]MCA1637177.1 tetratricopeptide repeat protein [Acidobacteriota bacterium]
MRSKFLFGLVILITFAVNSAAQKSALQTRTITVISEPNAIVWLDDVKRGTTDANGKLIIKAIPAGKHILRVRADGFKEVLQNLLPSQSGDVKITLAKTTDEAELAFQEAERLTASDRQKAVEAYRKAIRLRPKFPEAQLALARVLLDAADLDGAIKAVKAAQRLRPGYAEASAVEARIYVAEGNEVKAIAAFKRAIAEGKGFQPEAYTGLGLLYKEKAEEFAGEGDYENEKANYALATQHLKKAVSQLAGAPDAITIYQLLGLAYERMKNYKDAIALYEEFLQVFPDSSEASAVQSFIVQIKKQMKGEQ